MKPYIPFKKFQCPFCSQDFALHECDIFSKVDNQIIRKGRPHKFSLTVDTIFTRELNRKLAYRQCPHCRNTLPRNIETVDDNVTIAVIGDSFSGKSHYIAAAIDQLRNGQIPPEVGPCLFKASEDEIEERYLVHYHQPLFQNKTPLPATIVGFDPITEPLIYQFTLQGPPHRCINLLIYDVAGETLRSQQQLVMYRPHILNAKAILFLVDPWAMKGFRDRLAHHLRPQAHQLTGRVADSVLQSVVELFRNDAGQIGHTRFRTPIAIVLSKSDLLRYLTIDPFFHDLYSPEYNHVLDIHNESPVDDAIRKLLEEINERSLLQLADSFEYTRFFASSATGESVDSSGTFPSITPYRCLDPLLWILKELRILTID